MCRGQNETHEHLILHCPVAWKLWCFIFGIHGEEWVCPDSVEALFTGRFLGFGRSKLAQILWQCVMFSTLWGIWSKRNSRIFRDE